MVNRTRMQRNQKLHKEIDSEIMLLRMALTNEETLIAANKSLFSDHISEEKKAIKQQSTLNKKDIDNYGKTLFISCIGVFLLIIVFTIYIFI